MHGYGGLELVFDPYRLIFSFIHMLYIYIYISWIVRTIQVNLLNLTVVNTHSLYCSVYGQDPVWPCIITPYTRTTGYIHIHIAHSMGDPQDR